MTNRLTTEQLEAIRKRADKATKGPWEVIEEIDGIYGGMNTVVITTKPHTQWAKRIVSVGQTRKHVKGDAEANVEFIAAVREDIPKLLAEVEALTAKISEAESLLSEAHDIMDDVHLYDTELYVDISKYLYGEDDE